MSEQQGVWSGLLRGVAARHRLPDGTVLVLGDPGCGKSSVVAAMRAGGEPAREQPGGALGYSFMEVVDADEAAPSRVGVWEVAAAANVPLLELAVREAAQLSHSLVMVVLDLSKPWAAEEALLRWMETAEEAVRRLAAATGEPAAAGDARRAAVRAYLQAYAEPEEEAPLRRAAAGRRASELGGPAEELPLPEGTLTTNLGVPVVVVGAKADALMELDLPESTLDFIQGRLRELCLRFGAALYFCGGKTAAASGAALRDYVQHRLYPAEFVLAQRSQVDQHETLRVPAGCDSRAVIEQLHGADDRDVPFGEVVPAPASASKPSVAAADDAVEEAVEEEAAWLARLLQLSKAHAGSETSSTAPPEAPSGSSDEPSSSSDAAGGDAPASGAGDAAGDGADVDTATVASFFNSLLTRNKGGGASDADKKIRRQAQALAAKQSGE